MLPIFLIIAAGFISQYSALSINENDINIRVEAGSRTCFFEKGKAGQTLDVFYQVLDGQHGELDIIFELSDPKGNKLVSDYKKSQNAIIMDLTLDGDYVFCMDNTFSMMNSKLVFVAIVIEDKRKVGDKDTEVGKEGDKETKVGKEGDKETKVGKEGVKETKVGKEGVKDTEVGKEGDKETKVGKEGDKETKVSGGEVKEEEVLEWTGVDAKGDTYYVEVNKIAESLTRTLQHVLKARKLLEMYGAMKSRDSYLAFEDTFIVDCWSGFQISFMFIVGMLQVFMIKKLFSKPTYKINSIY